MRCGRPSPAVVAAAALLGALFCLWCYGTTILDGGAVGWLLTAGDRAQSFLGWHHYRHASETFPLGGIPTLLSPVGASLAYTDSAPWFAIALKPLSPLLPATFQISGLWLVLSYALLAGFAFLVLRELGVAAGVAVAGAVLIVMSPALAWRGMHLSLCAHWLVVAAFWAFLVTRRNGAFAHFAAVWTPLLVLASGTHPYLAAMVIAIALAACASATSPVRVAARVALVLAVTGTGLLVFGYFGGQSVEDVGFGRYSANLLTLVDPGPTSKLLPRLPSERDQYEGFGFLGSGVLALLVACLVWRFLGRRSAADDGSAMSASSVAPRELALLAVAVAAMALFALSSRVLVGTWQVASARSLYAALEPLPSAFRSSGRFIWPLHYALILGVVILVANTVRRTSWAIAAIVAASALQLWDQSTLYTGNDASRARTSEITTTIRSPLWGAIGKEYDELRLVPPYVRGADCLPNSYAAFHYVSFAYVAGLDAMRINSGHLSRQPYEAIRRACRDLSDEVAVGHMDPRVAYVVSDDALLRFSALALGLAKCGRVDRFNVCVRADRKTRFSAMLPYDRRLAKACDDMRPRL